MTALIREPNTQLHCPHCGTGLDVPNSKLVKSQQVLHSWQRALEVRPSTETLAKMVGPKNTLRQRHPTIEKETLASASRPSGSQDCTGELLAVLRWEDDGGAVL